METITGTPLTSDGVPLVFDTYAVIKDFMAAGFTEKQAEVVTDKIVGIINSNLATKIDITDIRKDLAGIRKDIVQLRSDTQSDIEQLRADTRSDIEKLRADTRADIATLKADLTKWMFGGFLTTVAMLVAILFKIA